MSLIMAHYVITAPFLTWTKLHNEANLLKFTLLHTPWQRAPNTKMARMLQVRIGIVVFYIKSQTQALWLRYLMRNISLNLNSFSNLLPLLHGAIFSLHTTCCWIRESVGQGQISAEIRLSKKKKSYLGSHRSARAFNIDGALLFLTSQHLFGSHCIMMILWNLSQLHFRSSHLFSFFFFPLQLFHLSQA